MAWTKFRLIARGDEYNADSLDHDGPACYELALGGPRGGNLRIVYVGETTNERRRIRQYAYDGSHLDDIIHSHLRDGWCLYYRGYAMSSKAAAKQMQDRMLADYDYDWNLVGNR